MTLMVVSVFSMMYATAAAAAADLTSSSSSSCFILHSFTLSFIHHFHSVKHGTLCKYLFSHPTQSSIEVTEAKLNVALACTLHTFHAESSKLVVESSSRQWQGVVEMSNIPFEKIELNWAKLFTFRSVHHWEAGRIVNSTANRNSIDIKCDILSGVCAWFIYTILTEIVDWYESQWWLNATKNGSSQWKNGGRNRTKVYIYPSYGHFDEIDGPKTTTHRTSSVAVATSATSTNASLVNHAATDGETLIILPGSIRQQHNLHSIYATGKNVAWKTENRKYSQR